MSVLFEKAAFTRCLFVCLKFVEPLAHTVHVLHPLAVGLVGDHAVDAGLEAGKFLVEA